MLGAHLRRRAGDGALFLYSSAVENRRPVSYDVILNGKTVYSGVPAKAAPGEASILKLEETVKVRSVRIRCPMTGARRIVSGFSDVQLFQIGEAS